MKFNKVKLKATQFMLIEKVNDEEDVRKLLQLIIEKITKGQKSRELNTLGESWGVEDLERLYNCIEFKQ